MRKRRTLEQVIRTRANSANSRASKLRIPGRVDAGILIEAWMLSAEPKLCPFCKRKLGVSNLSLDHIVPLSRGGGNHTENTWWVCLKCNRYRGNLTVEEYGAFLLLLEEAGWTQRFFQHYRPRGYGGR